MTKTPHDILVIGPPKEAALYFDRIFPFDLALSLTQIIHKQDVTNNIPFDGSKFDRDVIKSLLPDVQDNEEVYTEITRFSMFLALQNIIKNDIKNFQDNLSYLPSASRLFSYFGIDQSKYIDDLKHKADSDRKYFDTLLEKSVFPLIKKSGFEGSSIWHELDFQDRTDDLPNRYLATLSGLKLVDPSKISWDALVEFRKDEASRGALRDLRLYFSENFAEQDVSYASDKLASTLEKYEKTSKLWGFETAQRSLSVIFSKSTAVAASLGTLTTAALGMSLPATAAAGAAMALGPGLLELAKIAIDHEKQLIDRPLRYLSSLKKLQTKSS